MNKPMGHRLEGKVAVITGGTKAVSDWLRHNALSKRAPTSSSWRDDKRDWMRPLLLLRRT
jgi:hypothetical protein